MVNLLPIYYELLFVVVDIIITMNNHFRDERIKPEVDIDRALFAAS